MTDAAAGVHRGARERGAHTEPTVEAGGQRASGKEFKTVTITQSIYAGLLDHFIFPAQAPCRRIEIWAFSDTRSLHKYNRFNFLNVCLDNNLALSALWLMVIGIEFGLRAGAGGHRLAMGWGN